MKQENSRKLNIVLTGGNSGIGYMTAMHLYNQGHRIIIGSRNIQKNQQAVRNISQSGKGYIKSYPLDLSMKKSIEEFAQNVKKQFPEHIDQLINNSGMIINDKRISQLSVQMTFTINHCGHFYLTYLLFDLLKASQQARILNLSSLAHTNVSLKQGYYDHLGYQNRDYSGLQAYSVSKLANVHFAQGLAKRLNEKYPHIKAVSIHPGFVESGFGQNQEAQTSCIFRAFKSLKCCLCCCMINSEQGAQTTIYTSQLHFSKLKNGEYYADSAYKQMDKRGRDQKQIEKLWGLSERLYGIKFSI